MQSEIGSSKLTQREEMINAAEDQWDKGGIIKLKGNQILEKVKGSYVLKRLNSKTNTYDTLTSDGSVIVVENKEALKQQF